MRDVMRLLAAGLLVTVVTVAAVGSGIAQGREIRLSPASFPLPLGVDKYIPAGVPPEDVFVSDDYCFYYRIDGKFYRAYCIG